RCFSVSQLPSFHTAISCCCTFFLFFFFFFFLNDPAPTEIYPLPLHDALPISLWKRFDPLEVLFAWDQEKARRDKLALKPGERSGEHTSELQSQFHLVCRL